MSTDQPDDTRENDVERRRSASPPCSMGDVDPACTGPIPADKLLALLNQLLEGERAGARGITETCLPLAPAADHEALREIAVDEGRFCSMLYRHIVRLDGTPSSAVGGFVDKLAQTETFVQRLELLNRGQGWVVRKLRDVLPRIDDERLRADLAEMLLVHEQNIERCNALM